MVAEHLHPDGGEFLGVGPAGAAQRFEAVAFCLGQGDSVSLDLAQRRLEVVQAADRLLFGRATCACPGSCVGRGS